MKLKIDNRIHITIESEFYRYFTKGKCTSFNKQHFINEITIYKR